MSKGITRRSTLVGGAAILAAALPGTSRAQTKSIKIGVLSDFSGAYSDWSGKYDLACVQQAADEAKAAFPGLTVEVVQGDHLNKADVGATIARRWMDVEGVDAIVDVNNSSVGLAVNFLVKERDKVFLASGTMSTDLTGKQCTPNTVHWTYDTYMYANSASWDILKADRKRCFIIAADYTFGHLLQQQLTSSLEEHGVKVVGAVRYPFPATTDFSSFLLQAQASGADVVAFATAGADTVACVKQAREFGLQKGGMQLQLLVGYITDVLSMGLKEAAGLRLSEPFYWDLNDRTRAFAKRYHSRVPDKAPNSLQAGAYASTLHYLKAVADLGLNDAKQSGRRVVERMKKMPTDDDCFGKGLIRADGRKIHPCYLFETKAPDDSRDRFDCFRLMRTVPAEDAFRPLRAGGCSLVPT